MGKLKLFEADAATTGKFESKDEALDESKKLQEQLYDLLYLMFAHDKHSMLVILQGIDTSGKDGVVRHLFASANPQGIRVFSFKKPSAEELRHDIFWRCHKHTPESGLAAIFNRSYYEEVTTVMVHPELLKLQRIPEMSSDLKGLFKSRYEHINAFEKMLSQRGTVVLKFFLHISKVEQKERLKARLKDRKRNWKFSEADVVERKYWDKYMDSYEKMLKFTHTKHAPWHIVPANTKWYRDYLISKITVEALAKLKMSFPKSNHQMKSIR